MSQLQDVLRDLGVFAIAVTAIVSAVSWAFRQWLKQEHAQAIERLRADLKLVATEHEVRFRHPHEKVAETVAETHSKLWKFFERVGDYVMPGDLGGLPPWDERHELVVEATNEFCEYFYPRRIYFDESVADRVHSFAKQLGVITMEMKLSLEATLEGDTTDPKWLSRHKVLRNEATPLFRELQDIFRKLIGVKTADKNTQDGREGTES